MQMIEQTTGLGDATVTGDTVLKNYFCNLVNQWYRTMAYYAWKADKGWSFDDTNQTTFPVATTTIVNNQRDYKLATTDLRVRQVEVMQANGKYVTLAYMAEDSGALYTQKEQEPAGMPTHFRLSGISIILYPKPDTTVVTAAAGLRVTTDRNVSAFVTTDTTKVPGFAEQFHPVLYYGPCLEWARIKQNTGVEKACSDMIGDFEGLIPQARAFFGDRNQTIAPILQRTYQSYR